MPLRRSTSITHSRLRWLVELRVRVDDLDPIEASLAKLDVVGKRDETSLRVLDPNSKALVVEEIAPHLVQTPVEQVPCSGPGRPVRTNGRAPGVERVSKVRPQKLGGVTSGAWAGTASGPTSSGTSGIPPAISPSARTISTASSTTRCGSPRPAGAPVVPPAR